MTGTKLALSARALDTFSALSRHANEHLIAQVPRERLATEAGCSVSTLDKALSELIGAGYVDVLRERRGLNYLTNRYFLYPNADAGDGGAAWRSAIVSNSSDGIYIHTQVMREPSVRPKVNKLTVQVNDAALSDLIGRTFVAVDFQRFTKNVEAGAQLRLGGYFTETSFFGAPQLQFVVQDVASDDGAES